MFDRSIHFKSILAFLFTALIMGAVLRFVLPVRDFVIASLLPPYVGTVHIWESGAQAVSRISGENDLAKTVISLRARVAELEAGQLLDKNLIEQFYSVNSPERAIPGQVIDAHADATGNQGALIYDEGADVREGDLVVDNGVLVGRIEHAGQGVATLMYAFAPLQKIDGILIPKEVPVVLGGKGGGFYGAKILKDVEVQEGDIFVDATSREIILGEITSIERSPAKPFTEVLIRAPMMISTLYDVLILPHDR